MGYAEEYDFFTRGGCSQAGFPSKSKHERLLCFSSIAKLGDSSRKAVEHF